MISHLTKFLLDKKFTKKFIKISEEERERDREYIKNLHNIFRSIDQNYHCYFILITELKI